MPEQLLVPGLPLTQEEHLAEQQTAQEGKNRSRWLSDYDDIIFRQSLNYDPRQTIVSEALRPETHEGFMSLLVIVENMQRQKGSKLNIVDMGAGAGIAMRELAVQPELKGALETTTVDLFGVGSEVFDEFTQEHIVANPAIMLPEVAPRLIQADAEKVVLNEPPDLILSAESIQYINNPLAAIVNWYNQLADGGLLIIAREGDFATNIHYRGGQAHKDGLPLIEWRRNSKDQLKADEDPLPVADLLAALDIAGINLVAMDGHADGIGYPYKGPKPEPGQTTPWLTSLVIEKKAGTFLNLNSSLAEVRPDDNGFKTVFYEPLSEDHPLVEVVDLAPDSEEKKVGNLSLKRSVRMTPVEVGEASQQYPLELLPPALREEVRARREEKKQFKEEMEELNLP